MSRRKPSREIHAKDSLRPAPRSIYAVLVLNPVWAPDQVVIHSIQLRLFPFWLPLWEEKTDQTCRRVQSFLQPLFSHGDRADSLHTDGESLTYLCRLQGHHDLVHCGYESDHETISYKFPGPWLRLFPNPLHGCWSIGSGHWSCSFFYRCPYAKSGLI